MPAAIDTLKFAKRQRQANFTEPQAEALAEAVAEATVENVATKLDIVTLRAAVKQDIADLRTELKQDIAARNAEDRSRDGLKQAFRDLRADLHSEFAALRLEMKAMGSRLVRWMCVGFAATIAILGTLIVFGHH